MRLIGTTAWFGSLLTAFSMGSAAANSRLSTGAHSAPVRINGYVSAGSDFSAAEPAQIAPPLRRNALRASPTPGPESFFLDVRHDETR